MEIKDLLQVLINRQGSDLHLAPGYEPVIRVDGRLTNVSDQKLDLQQVITLLYSILPEDKQKQFEEKKELDVSYTLKETGDRFRVNIYTMKGAPAAAFRLVPRDIKTIEELRLPEVLYDFTKLSQGLVLCAGPTGHGKSTTLASLLQEINKNNYRHILTVEDPIEYVYPRGLSMISQREIGTDTENFEIALRSALREDIDVVLVGELRDYETTAAAITIAETGHLVFGTIHTNDASQTIDRIIDIFPHQQQPQVRAQLASVLEGVISQRLIPQINGGRVVAAEVLIASPAIKNLIREGKVYQINNVLQTSADLGMITLEKSLVSRVKDGLITIDDAQHYAENPDEVMRLLRGNKA